MKYKENHIEYLKSLAFREPMRRDWNRWGSFRPLKHDHRSIYDIADYVIKEFYGKSVNDAFSKYMKITDGRYINTFWDQFAHKDYNGYRWYMINDEGIITKSRKYKNRYRRPKDEYVWYSPDYETKRIWYTPSGVLLSEYPDLEKRMSIISPDMRKVRGFTYKIEVTNGYTITFDKDSKNYKRFRHESRDFRRKQRRNSKAYERAKVYSFLTQSEERRKLDEEKNLVDRDRLGFNDESFKFDPYHGKQRKKKKNKNN